ncbi:PLC-like phosphodiesterase, TIM beta/alpha-barrel domain [Trichophyton rubrum]|nr:PLC-like phosphodiesterase, TIM beta/alpha-barrel domain [Trichophyton rubrum]
MKFGRNLPRNMVPEWSSSYIKYKSLKKLIKSAVKAKTMGNDPDLAGFFYSLDRNLEDVDSFYNKKFSDCSRRLKLLEDRFGHPETSPSHLDSEDTEDLLAALLELRGQLRKLQWYGEVNRRGFIKITKKLDKKLPGANAQIKYLSTKVNPAMFATNSRLLHSVNSINEWLSVLGHEKVMDDNSSTHSALSLKKPSSGVILNLPTSLLLSVDDALRRDDTNALLDLLPTLKTATDGIGEAVFTRVLMSLQQRSIFYRSKACLASLLQRVTSLEEEDDINKRNCIHRLVISIGRSQSTVDPESSATMVLNFPTETSNYITPATTPTLKPQRPVVMESDHPTHIGRDSPVVMFLQYLLDNLLPHQRPALLARDISGKTPLHFAAQYGFKAVCDVIIEHLQEWDMFDVSEGIDGPLWQDEDGMAPLHLSVVGGHPLTTKTLLDSENWKGSNQDKTAIRRNILKSSAVLALATKANFVDIVHLLVQAGVNINYQDEQGETALHSAARFGHDQCAAALLKGSDEQKANIELAENTYAWTPLFIASVDGNINIVKLLIEAGANLETTDSSGWTAKEHATLRGHIDIARLLDEAMATSDGSVESDAASQSVVSSSPPSQSSLNDRNSKDRAPDAVKSFGHRYLTDKSMILVSLGTMDMRKTADPVSLERIPMAEAHLTQLDTALSIVVSASGAQGEPQIIDLPVQDNISTEPIVFHTADSSKTKIVFDLVPTYAGSKDQVFGRGVALLSSFKPTVGSSRSNLQGDFVVPLIAAKTLEIIGSVTFNFLVITPFSHPKMSITEEQTYWKSVTSPMVIGHRGLGKNIAGRHSLQLGENTVQSFIAAANLGASYVEVNVQLTKDHVPVIYHDFLVSETGIDAPVHTLTLEQFLHISDGRKPAVKQSSNHSGTPNSEDGFPRLLQTRPRSMSVGEELDVPNLSERMKHTRDFKKKGFKGNSRGDHIQAPFATLEELFKELPKSAGFNMELKYPMLHESEEEEMDTYAVELNSFVDNVLRIVYDYGEGRNMIFSSFNPDICLLLSFKQPSIPVLFLTDSGVSPVADIRASSLQEAIRFASRWNLLGIVTNAEPLVLSPRLVKVVKESGLVCVSYGTINNDPANVKIQVNEGIDAVIVDSVLAIRQGLTGVGA